MATAHTVGPPLAPAIALNAPTTFVAALHTSAVQLQRGITFVVAGGAHFLSYAALLEEARSRLGALQELGLRKGDAVVMQLPELREHIGLMWAAILGGIAPVNIAVPPRYDRKSGVVQKLLGVVEDLRAQHVLAAHSNAASLRDLLAPVASGCTVHDTSELRLHRPFAEPAITAEDVLFYQLTSGSTGKSKVIPERHCAVISHARHSAAHCKYTSEV